MFGENQHHYIDSIVGHTSTVDGTLTFRGGLRVDGRIRGDVVDEPAGSGYLLLSRSGRIEGNIRVARIVVSGEIFGNLHVSGMVKLRPSARIIGDVHYLVLAMQSGALVSGKLSHQTSLAIPVKEPLLSWPESSAGSAAKVYNPEMQYYTAGA
jgi:cytoskeletal protein CcmA (bactofilin family)